MADCDSPSFLLQASDSLEGNKGPPGLPGTKVRLGSLELPEDPGLSR